LHPQLGAGVERWPTIAGYEILGELGRGGMGVVYKARQVGLNRLVALKMILDGPHASPGHLARFRREAEAVARLCHPNIVHIHDIGEQEGRPFFSMEYVEGGNLAQRLAGKPQPSRSAAQLVETLARAVHAAHQQSIVHRDLKPANILLSGARQGIGGDALDALATLVPKISDFGLVKYVEAESPDRQTEKQPFLGLARTESGALMGSPSYMAPEQARSTARNLGPAADVYALGAILYELLTGRPPFIGAAPLDTVLQVLHEEPVSPRQLQPKLSRDLETICLKCLRKEPHKRYSTALELAEDLCRFQEGKPIKARPVGHVERIWRWSRRNPLVAGLLALIGLLLIGGTVVSSSFAVQAKRAEKEAKESQADTEAFSNFLTNDLLAAARPKGQDGGLGIDVTVRQALDEASPRVGQRFAGRPRAEAKARAAWGLTYLHMGESKGAIEQLEPLRELHLQEYGPDHPITLDTMNKLAWAYQIGGRSVEALRLFEDSLDRLQRTLGPDHPSTLRCMTNLANVYQDAERRDEALPLYEEALRRGRAKLAADDTGILRTMYNLATAYQDCERLSEAQRLFEETGRLRRARLGPDHPEVGRAFGMLGACLVKAKKHADAEAPLREACRIYEMQLPDSWERFAFLSVFGASLLGQQRFAEAEQPLLESYEGMKQRENSIRRNAKKFMTDNVERLVELYDNWGQKDKAAHWRKKLPVKEAGKK
jgi:serine/threonine protein kinase/tetratricopeptide (TPR) repeat protein